MQVALKFAADSKSAGSSLQPVAQCSFLKSDLSFFPLPCFSHAASPLTLNTLNTSSVCRGRDESSGGAGEAEVKVTMGAISLNYQTLCLQRPSTLMQYFNRNLPQIWKQVYIGSGLILMYQEVSVLQPMKAFHPVTCISFSLPFPRRKQGK